MAVKKLTDHISCEHREQKEQKVGPGYETSKLSMNVLALAMVYHLKVSVTFPISTNSRGTSVQIDEPMGDISSVCKIHTIVIVLQIGE